MTAELKELRSLKAQTETTQSAATIIKPRITNDYLHSAEVFLSQLDGLLAGERVSIKPAPLEETPYHLILYETTDRREGKNMIVVRLVNSKEEHVNGIPSGAIFSYRPGTSEALVEVSGIFINNTHRVREPTEPPVCNLSGIIAPVEDAICFHLAGVLGRPVRRKVNTSEPTSSKFVRNYRRRGYGMGAIRQEGGVVLERLFFPQQKSPEHSLVLH